jgi:hypothetical protein
MLSGQHNVTWLPKFLTCGRFPWEAPTSACRFPFQNPSQAVQIPPSRLQHPTDSWTQPTPDRLLDTTNTLILGTERKSPLVFHPERHAGLASLQETVAHTTHVVTKCCRTGPCVTRGGMALASSPQCTVRDKLHYIRTKLICRADNL